MLSASGERIEKFLYRKGYRSPEIRVILRWQILLTIISILTGLIVSPFSLWGLWIAVGASLATYSFYSLAGFVQKALLEGFSRRTLSGLLVRFYGRLMLTGLILFGLLIWLRVPPAAIIVGFIVISGTVPVWLCIKRAGRNFKEA